MNTIGILTARPEVVATVISFVAAIDITETYTFPIIPDGSGKTPLVIACVPGHSHPDVPLDKFPLRPY